MLRSIGFGWGLVLVAHHACGEILVRMGGHELRIDARPHGIAIQPGQGSMYWVDSGAKARVQKSNLNGLKVQILADKSYNGLKGPKGIAVTDAYDSKLYWTDTAKATIWRSDLDGDNIEDVGYRGGGAPGFLALDGKAQKMYWTDPEAQEIRTASMINASNYSAIFTTATLAPSRPEGIVVVPHHDLIYWADPVLGKICRSNMNGSDGITDVVVLGMGRNEPYGLAYDKKADTLYWTDRRKMSIHRIKSDGSKMEEVAIGLGDPTGIAFDSQAGTVYWADQGLINISRLRVSKHGKTFLGMCLVFGASVVILGGVGVAVFMHVPIGHFFGEQCSRMKGKCSRMRRRGNQGDSSSSAERNCEDSSMCRGLVNSTGIPLTANSVAPVPMYQVVQSEPTDHPFVRPAHASLAQ